MRITEAQMAPGLKAKGTWMRLHRLHWWPHQWFQLSQDALGAFGNVENVL